MVAKAAGRPCLSLVHYSGFKGQSYTHLLILALILLSFPRKYERISGWFHIHINEEKARFGCVVTDQSAHSLKELIFRLP